MKLASHPGLEFRFISTPSYALREMAKALADTAIENAERASGCNCPPWDDCGHGDRVLVALWVSRARKLWWANDAALMKVLLAPLDGNIWRTVDELTIGSDLVARP